MPQHAHATAALLPGNKQWKLQANLAHVACCGLAGIVAVGGRRSTLLHSLARAAQAQGVNAIGIVPFYASLNRPAPGVETLSAEHWLAPDQVQYADSSSTPAHIRWRGFTTATLQDCSAAGMGVLEIPAVLFRERMHAHWQQRLAAEFPRHLILPEGGSNGLAVRSVAEHLRQLFGSSPPAHLALGVGTGATAAGAALALGATTTVHAYEPAGIEGAAANIRGWKLHGCKAAQPVPRLRAGGSTFGQLQEDDLELVESVLATTGVLLDPLYGVGVLSGVLRDIAAGYFTPADEIVILHTGGLQSWRGFEHRCSERLRSAIHAFV